MKNNTILTIVASLALGAAAYAGTPSGKGVPVVEPAATSPLSTTLTVGYASTYEYRGLEIGDNLFSVDLTSTYKVNDNLSFNLGAWYGTMWDGNYVAVQRGGNMSSQTPPSGPGAPPHQRKPSAPVVEGNGDELDLTGGATYDFGPVNLGLLYRHYLYDGTVTDNNEVGLTLSTDAWNGLSLNVQGYYDFEFEGFYFETGATYNQKLTDMISFSAAAGVSYVSDYVIKGTDGFNHAFLQLGLPITLRSNVVLTPFVKGVLPIDVLDDAGGDDFVLGGASLAVTF